MKVTTIGRVFLFEGHVLEDVAPELSPTKSAMIYQDLFPDIARCIALPDKVVDGNWFFNVIRIA